MGAEERMPGIIDAIQERRSVRQFTEAGVTRRQAIELLKAASWAPSGLNNQPWRFALVFDSELRDQIASLTRYSTVLRSAPLIVPVFLDSESSYDRVKDCQAVGACIQNLLLAAHASGLGAVWIGEILKNGDRVIQILDLPDRLELMAIVAIGEPAHRNQKSHRRPPEELIVFEK